MLELIANFRPEKDHAAQLKALCELFKKHPEYRASVRLVMVGGCRNADDTARVDGLRALAKDLAIEVCFFLFFVYDSRR